MKSEISLFRILLSAQIAFGVLGVGIAIFTDGQLPEELLHYNERTNEEYSTADGLFGFGLSISALVVIIGLFMLRPWAKIAYLLITVVMLGITFFSPPPTAAPGSATALYELASMTGGATLFMLYCTEFGRSWTTLRTRAQA
ncbi:hypothetical protein [Rariglobus hedericola]|uniref:DUF4345 domain-containing protein n=1 Tax=Rariglobus hedericola TaxID=2597822 RepID=A0A556QJH0_9BACT|nr:hypothetical protein [Rariglobus hedericola]TSJ76767.1 hypothetical protein FPL22_11620 [Rariglobus hedericola]